MARQESDLLPKGRPVVFRAIKVVPLSAGAKKPSDPVWVFLEITEGELKGSEIVVMFREGPEEYGPPRRLNLRWVENVSLGPEDWSSLRAEVRAAVQRYKETTNRGGWWHV